MKKVYLLILVLLFVVGCVEEDKTEDGFLRDDVIIYFFSDDGCPFCRELKPYLEELANEYDEVKLKEIKAWSSSETIAMFQEVAGEFGKEVEGVPMTFIGEQSWNGFHESLIPQMEAKLEQCINDGCEDKSYDIVFEEE